MDEININDLQNLINKRLESDHTPDADNICLDNLCQGEIVRKVISITNGVDNYGPPTCMKCNRLYLLAKNVRKVNPDHP